MELLAILYFELILPFFFPYIRSKSGIDEQNGEVAIKRRIRWVFILIFETLKT